MFALDVTHRGVNSIDACKRKSGDVPLKETFSLVKMKGRGDVLASGYENFKSPHFVPVDDWP